MNRSTRFRPESADPFAMQLALSRVHARLVPMQRDEHGYSLDPSAEGWVQLPAGRGFAGYGLGRALRMLLDVLRGLTALHDTFDAEGVNFAHGEVALVHFRVDSEGVCRLVPLTARHSAAESTAPVEAIGHLAPERLLGEAVDSRADVFSAGVLLWEALAGRRLFSETTSEAIIDRLMGEKLPMPQLPPELAWAIPLKSIAARALSVDPYQRFADCAELATAIAIVARERVATHAEIISFFGIKARSVGSVAQARPVPTRSSTFPSVSLPVSLPSVSAPPSSRNGFPLATPTSRSVTPAPRAVTPAPRAVTPAPNSVRGPESSQRNSKSPFATLLGAGESMPASHRRKTLTSVGTPLSAPDPIDAAPVSTERLSKSPPPLPLWAKTLAGLAPPSQAPTSSSAVVARARLESIPLAEEVAKLRGWSSRRSLIVLSLLVIAGAALLLLATRGGDAPQPPASNPQPGHVQAAALGAVVAATVLPEPATPADDHAR
ncbi:MAG TPA: hypothetical protein VGC79_34625, partial [Polyangiaceae bacterium]